MKVTKATLVSQICKEHGIDRKKATEALNAILRIAKDSMASGESLLLSGFGKFHVNDKAERKGRNPSTGEEAMLPARRVIVFKASSILRDRVNVNI